MARSFFPQFSIMDSKTVQRSALCRSRRELSNAYLLAKIGVDTAENEPVKVWGENSIQYSFASEPSDRVMSISAVTRSFVDKSFGGFQTGPGFTTMPVATLLPVRSSPLRRSFSSPSRRFSVRWSFPSVTKIFSTCQPAGSDRRVSFFANFAAPVP